MAELFGTVTAAVSMVDLLHKALKDFLDRKDKAIQNPDDVKELTTNLETLLSQLEPIKNICDGNQIKFSEDSLNTFKDFVRKLEEGAKVNLDRLMKTSKKFESRLFRYRKAKTTSKMLSQLRSFVEKADSYILTMAGFVANAELIVNNNASV